MEIKLGQKWLWIYLNLIWKIGIIYFAEFINFIYKPLDVWVFTLERISFRLNNVHDVGGGRESYEIIEIYVLAKCDEKFAGWRT